MTITPVQSKSSQATASSLTTAWNSTPVSGNLLVMRIVAGNGVSSAEVITDPAHWTPVYGTQPQGSSGTSRAAAQIYWRIADGTTNDNAPVVSLSTNSRAVAQLSEYSSTNGWPTTPVDVIYTASTAAGSTPVSGSGTTAASAVILAEIIQISSSTSVTWAGNVTGGADQALLQGTTNFFSAGVIVTTATSGSASATLTDSKLYIIAATSFKDNGAALTATGSVSVSASAGASVAAPSATGSVSVNATGAASSAGRSVFSAWTGTAPAQPMFFWPGHTPATMVTAPGGQVSVNATAGASAAAPTATGSVSAAATGAAAGAAAGTGSVAVSASGSWVAPPATGSVSASATASVAAAAGGSGAVSVTGSASWVAPPATGSVSVNATAGAAAAATGTGSVSVAGTGGWVAPPATGSVAVNGTAGASAAITASGAVAVNGTGALSGTAIGAVAVSATGSASAPAAATASVAVTASSTARVPVTASGAISVTATVTGAGGASGVGQVQVQAAAGATVIATASGAVTVLATAAPGVAAAATGSVSVVATGAAHGPIPLDIPSVRLGIVAGEQRITALAEARITAITPGDS